MNRTFRGSYISMITWLIIAAVILFPLCRSISGHGRPEFYAAVIFMVALFALVILYHMHLRVELGDDSITRHTLFGTRKLQLSSTSRFRYAVTDTEVGYDTQTIILMVLSACLPARYRKKYRVTIESGGRKMSLSSAVSDVHLIGEYLQQYELAFILPAERENLENGGVADHGVLKITAREIAVGLQHIPRPLAEPPRITGGSITFPSAPESKTTVKLSLPDIWNPMVLLDIMESDPVPDNMLENTP